MKNVKIRRLKNTTLCFMYKIYYNLGVYDSFMLPNAAVCPPQSLKFSGSIKKEICCRVIATHCWIL